MLLLAAAQTLRADSTWEFSVQVSATVQTSPAQITLSWPQDTYMVPNSYTVYRKDPSATSWSAVISLPGTATSYIDNNVSVGSAYEYQIVKAASQYTGYGYIYSGINVPLNENRGKVLLVIVVVGITGFYLAERFWLSKKVEAADPERLQELEQVAQEKLQELKQEFQEHIPFKQSRHEEPKKRTETKNGKAERD